MKNRLCNIPAERLSKRVLTVLLVLSALIFGLYYGIGYNTPSEMVAGQNEPRFLNVLFVLLYGLPIISLCLVAWALRHAYTHREGDTDYVYGKHTRWMPYLYIGGFVVLLAVTFLLGSSTPLTVNGKAYTESFWLKTTDMFIFTSVALLFVGVLICVIGIYRSYRKS